MFVRGRRQSSLPPGTRSSMRRVVDISASRSGNRRASGDSCLLDLADLLRVFDLLDLLGLRADFFVDWVDFLEALERDDVFAMD